MTSINNQRREALAKRILDEVDLVTLVASFDPLERNQGDYAYGLEMRALIHEAKKLTEAESAEGVFLRLRVDPDQDPAEVEPDIDVYVSLPGGDEDNLEPQLQIKFTHEGVIIDAFEGGTCVGTSSEMYEEIHERLSIT